MRFFLSAYTLVSIAHFSVAFPLSDAYSGSTLSKSRFGANNDIGKDASALPLPNTRTRVLRDLAFLRLRAGAAAAGGAAGMSNLKPSPAPGHVSMTATTFNLAKNMIGGGMLALPAGMAAGGGTGWVPAYLMLVFASMLSGFTFYLVGSAVETTKANNFKELWEETLGKKTALIVDAMIMLLCGFVCVMYTCFIGDLFTSLFSGISWLPDFLKSRNSVVLGIVSTVILPLCLLRDLSALSYSSLVGLAAVAYTVFFIGVRFFDGSYAAGGQFYAPAAPSDSSPTKSLSLPGLFSIGSGSIVLINMLSTSYNAHPNAVKYYNELQNRTPARFLRVIATAFGVASIIYGSVMALGFKTFGMGSQGLILNNYHQSADMLASLGRLATGVSIIGAYPLLFTSFRDGFMSVLSAFLDRKDTKGVQVQPAGASNRVKLGTSNRSWAAITTLLVAVATGVGLAFTDIGLIVSLIGSLFGSWLIYILPAGMYLKSRSMHGNRASLVDKVASYSIIAFGLVMAVVGTYLALH